MALPGELIFFNVGIIATFVVSEKNSDVGFGTIVGSAVFNVLIIIGTLD